MKPLITIIGNVATGKSTMAEFLANELHAHLVFADELYKTNPFFNDAVVDRNRWSLASDTWFLMKRVEMTKQLQKILVKKPVVQDSGLLMSWVYSNSRLGLKQMNQNESSLYNTLYSTLTQDLPQETLVIALSLPVHILRQRIMNRGREFEIKFHSETYLENLTASINQLVTKLEHEHIPVLSFNETNWCDIMDNEGDQKRLLMEVKNYL